jgi:hypothetical protein
MAERKGTHCAGITNPTTSYSQKAEVRQKEKKKQKKEKRVEIWKTPRVSHISARQTSNKAINDYL